jgi:hypothetical protein
MNHSFIIALMTDFASEYNYPEGLDPRTLPPDLNNSNNSTFPGDSTEYLQAQVSQLQQLLAQQTQFNNHNNSPLPQPFQSQQVQRMPGLQNQGLQNQGLQNQKQPGQGQYLYSVPESTYPSQQANFAPNAENQYQSGNGSQPQESSFWAQVLGYLQKLAAQEIAGVSLYAFYSATIGGIESTTVACRFGLLVQDCLESYQQNLQFILRIDEGRTYLKGTPNPTEINYLPHDTNSGNPKVAIQRMIEFETRLSLLVAEFRSLVLDKDPVLEFFCNQKLLNKSQLLTELKSLMK